MRRAAGVRLQLRRVVALGALVLYSAFVAELHGNARFVAVSLPIACGLVAGARRGFAARARPSRPTTRGWNAAWAITIAILLAFELWQVTFGTTTVTSLVTPLLAIPILRIAAMAVWLRLGWRLIA